MRCKKKADLLPEIFQRCRFSIIARGEQMTIAPNNSLSYANGYCSDLFFTFQIVSFRITPCSFLISAHRFWKFPLHIRGVKKRAKCYRENENMSFFWKYLRKIEGWAFEERMKMSFSNTCFGRYFISLDVARQRHLRSSSMLIKTGFTIQINGAKTLPVFKNRRVSLLPEIALQRLQSLICRGSRPMPSSSPCVHQ